MKYFIYCESTDGGMELQRYSFNGCADIEFNLYGWMSEKYGCDIDDKKLLEWAKNCEIGEYFEHRSGICFRVGNL